MRYNVLAYTEKQGNMLRLTRKGLTGPRNYGLIDDVTATYTGNCCTLCATTHSRCCSKPRWT